MTTTEKGFHLLEVVVICGLIAITASWLVSEVVGLQSAFRLASAESTVTAELNRARQLAMTCGLPVRITWLAPDQFALEALGRQSSPVKLPGGVMLTAQPASPITFHSRGSAAPAGSYRLANASGETRVVVAVSGRVRTQRTSP